MHLKCLGVWFIQHCPNDRYHRTHALDHTATKSEIKSDPEVEILKILKVRNSEVSNGIPSDHLQRHPSNVIMTFGLVF